MSHKKLRFPLDVVLEPDADGYIARTVDLPLCSFGDDPFEATTLLTKEIEAVHDELMVDGEFSPDWLRSKEFLDRAIGDFVRYPSTTMRKPVGPRSA